MNAYSEMTLEELRETVRQLENRQPIPAPILHELHKRLWGWIVNNADDFPVKANWPGWDRDPGGRSRGTFGGRAITNRCFLCAVHFGHCDMCPLAGCDEYDRWVSALDRQYLPAYIDAAENIRDCIPEED